MSLANLPIRRKLMLLLLLTSTVVMLMTAAAFMGYEYVAFRRSTVQELSTLGSVIASNSTAALAFQNQDDAAEILSSLKAQVHVVAAGLYDRQGRLFARYPGALADARLPGRPGAFGYALHGATLSGFQAVMQEDRRLGTLYLEFDAGSAMRSRLWHSLEIALVVMVAILFVAYFLSRILQRQISDPILALAHTARAVAERDDYSVRAALSCGGEIGLLTGAFNQMLAQIHKLNQGLEQRVLQRTAQLELANKELEAFSYSVSHDLRAPLRHIDGFGQLLAQRLDGTLDATARHYLDTVTNSAGRLGCLIDELLSFSRMGRSEMQQARVDTRAMIDEAIQVLQPQTRDRRIEWRIGELPAVHGDPAMLKLVWANLVGNAVKYTGKREQAVIEINHRLDKVDGHVFSIRDNGAGFDMAHANKLFGVFHRLHHASEFEGTGVGLANVRRITERHGGRAWAEAKVDGGATFYFSIPASAPARSGQS